MGCHLKGAIGDSYFFVHGGCEFDGRPLHAPELDRIECLKVLEEIKQSWDRIYRGNLDIFYRF